MAVGHEFLGHYEQAISDLEQAARISPRDSNLGVWQTEMGRALMGLGRYDAAVQEGLIGIDLGVSHRYVLHGSRGVLCCGGQDAGGKSHDRGGDEIESQTVGGVVSRAHTFPDRLAAGLCVKP